MKNIDVIRSFLTGSNCKTKNLTSKDGQLINYTTVIARLDKDVVYLDSTRYSQTTSIIQNKVRQEVKTSTYKIQEVMGL